MKLSSFPVLSLLVALVGTAAHAQTNTFPTSGNVGIGTTSPSSLLQVYGGTSASVVDMLHIGNASGMSTYNDVETRVSIHGSGDNGTGRSTLFFGLYGSAGETSAKLSLNGINANDLGTSGLNNALQFFTVSNLPLQLGTNNTGRVLITADGNVGIGTTSPGSYRLAVSGAIRAKEVVVDTSWSDYVFAPDYRLPPLSEVEAQIKAEGHLPGIPSAKDVAEHGVNMGEIQSKLLAKIEELTLHQIEQERQIKNQAARLERLELENKKLQQR